MRKLLYIFLIIFSTAESIFGQKDTTGTTPEKIVWGTSIGTLYSIASYSLNYFAYGTLDKGKSFFALGPVLGPKLYFNDGAPHYPQSGEYRLNGFHCVYQINPNPERKRFDFYFQYQFIFLYYQTEGNNYDFVNGAIVTYPYNAYLSAVENFIGYGFKVKFLKSFFLTQSISIGLNREHTLIDHDNPNFHDYDYGYSWQPDFMINAGLGFNFNKK